MLTVQGLKVSGHGELQVPMVLESQSSAVQTALVQVQWLRGHPFFSKICEPSRAADHLQPDLGQGLKFVRAFGATGTHMPSFMHKLCSTAIKESLGKCVVQRGDFRVLDTAPSTYAVRCTRQRVLRS